MDVTLDVADELPRRRFLGAASRTWSLQAGVSPGGTRSAETAWDWAGIDEATVWHLVGVNDRDRWTGWRYQQEQVADEVVGGAIVDVEGERRATVGGPRREANDEHWKAEPA